MITIHYCAEGEPVPDFNYKEWIERVRKSIEQKENIVYAVSTMISIDAVLLEIAEDRFPLNEIQFKFETHTTSVDECGDFCIQIPLEAGNAHFKIICAISRAYDKKDCV